MAEHRRLWWGNPLVWLGISTVFVLLGLFVFPHFFGGVFLFLPFFWFRGFRSERVERTPRCPGCGAAVDLRHAYCPHCGTPLG